MNARLQKQIAIYTLLWLSLPVHFVQSTARSDSSAGTMFPETFPKCVNVKQKCAAQGSTLGCTKCKLTLLYGVGLVVLQAMIPPLVT